MIENWCCWLPGHIWLELKYEIWFLFSLRSPTKLISSLHNWSFKREIFFFFLREKYRAQASKIYWLGYHKCKDLQKKNLFLSLANKTKKYFSKHTSYSRKIMTIITSLFSSSSLSIVTVQHHLFYYPYHHYYHYFNF